MASILSNSLRIWRINQRHSLSFLVLASNTRRCMGSLRSLCTIATTQALPRWQSLHSPLHPTMSKMCSSVPFECLNIQDSKQFQSEVLANAKPVVLQFHADWCQPCKKLGGVLEKKLANRRVDVLYAKVNIDEHTQLAMDYNVVSIPTVLSIKKGEVTDTMIGAQDDDIIDTFIDKAIQ